jgi:hypothetical protein
MSSLRSTDRRISSLKAVGERVELMDGAVPGLGIRALPTGPQVHSLLRLQTFLLLEVVRYNTPVEREFSLLPGSHRVPTIWADGNTVGNPGLPSLAGRGGGPRSYACVAGRPALRSSTSAGAGPGEIRSVLARPQDKRKDPILPLTIRREELRARYKRKNWILPAPIEIYSKPMNRILPLHLAGNGEISRSSSSRRLQRGGLDSFFLGAGASAAVRCRPRRPRCISCRCRRSCKSGRSGGT